MAFVFVSYCSKDSEYANQLAATLISRGIKIWIDSKLPPGAKWWNEIEEALNRCSGLIIVMTPDSKASDWVQREILTAINLKVPIFPLLLAGENWPIFAPNQYIDVRSKPLPEAFFELVSKELTDKQVEISAPETYRPEPFSFGHLETTWLVIDGDGQVTYTPETVNPKFMDKKFDLPPILAKARDIVAKQEEEKCKEIMPNSYNGSLFCLTRFYCSRSSDEKHLALGLMFEVTDYYSYLASNQRFMSDSLEPEWSDFIALRKNHTWNEPSPLWVNSFGVNLAVVTRDGYLLLPRRGGKVSTRSGSFNASVTEGLSIDKDSVPDVYGCAYRGACEELARDIRLNNITFLSFGVDIAYAEWGLTGLATSENSRDEILQMRSGGVPDSFEIAEIHSILFDPEHTVRFVLSNKPWTSVGLICIYHALVYRFGRQNVDDVIKKYSKKID